MNKHTKTELNYCECINCKQTIPKKEWELKALNNDPYYFLPNHKLCYECYIELMTSLKRSETPIIYNTNEYYFEVKRLYNLHHGITHNNDCDDITLCKEYLKRNGFK